MWRYGTLSEEVEKRGRICGGTGTYVKSINQFAQFQCYVEICHEQVKPPVK